MKDPTLTLIDTACVLIDFGGFRILTDPTLDGPGRLYHNGFGALSHKTGTPKPLPGPIDIVLLSHHQHMDNLDRSGREFIKTVRTLSTPAAAKALPHVTGIGIWETVTIDQTVVPGLKVTGTPAYHRPKGMPEFLSGPAMGFVLEWDGQDGVTYISGDTIFFDGILEVGRRYKIDTAILHAGSAQFRYLSGPGRFTMNAQDLFKAVEALNPRKVVPIHHSGWKHFREPLAKLRPLLESNPLTKDRVVWID